MSFIRAFVLLLFFLGSSHLFFKFYFVEVIEPFASKIVEDKTDNREEEDICQEILAHIRL